MRITGVVVIVVLTSCCLADLTSSLAEVVQEVEGVEPEEEVLLFLDTAENVTVIFPSEEPGRASKNPRKLLWYLSAFGVLVALLLAAICAGCCCSEESMRQAPVERASCPTAEIDLPPQPPPPPYHLFAPPPYDALLNPSGKQTGPVFVIPIQGSSNEPPPPPASEQE